MKITCHACGAKYAIADEKVRGRRVKVRCKSCSEPIIVDGYAEVPQEEPDYDDNERTHMVSSSAAAAAVAAAPPADAWSVNLSDTDQRTMTTDELVAAWNAGQLPSDTYVWREGMDDWAPITATPDLLPYLAGGAPSAPAASAPAPDFGGYGAAPAAARVAGGRSQGGADLFEHAAVAGSEMDVMTSAPAPAPAAGSTPYAEPGSTPYDEPKMTGARNENSVLFSLDSLKAGLGPAKSSPSAASSPRASSPSGAKASLDDIMDLGGGGGMGNPLFALQQNQALLAAPPPPPEPPPRPVLPSDPALAGSIAPMPPQKNNNKLIIIVGGAVAAIAIIAVVIGVVVAKSGSGGEVAKAEMSDKGEKKSGASDSKKKDDAKKDDSSSSEKKDEGSSDEKKDDPSTASSSDDKKPVTEEDKKRFAEAMKKEQETKDKKPDDTKKEDVTKKDTPSEGVASFNKGAAIAALGAAAAQASGCKRPGGPTGTGRAVVTFATSGRVTSANVSGGEFPGTSVGSCVASVFRRANVPAFGGAPVTVSKSFTIPK